VELSYGEFGGNAGAYTGRSDESQSSRVVLTATKTLREVRGNQFAGFGCVGVANRGDSIKRGNRTWKACHRRGHYLCSMENPLRRVLVTGATSGIGLALTMELAETGYDVIATARNSEKAARLKTVLAEAGLTVQVLACDFERPDEVANAAEKVFEIWPLGPWAIVNNAGFAAPGAIEDVTAEIAQKQMAINVIAPAQVIRAFLPSMRARGSGRIVNISSVSGRVSSPFIGWYSASKFALEALSDALRVEVREFGIDVILIEPTGFASSIWANAVPLLPSNAQTGPYRRAYSKAQKLINSNFPEPSPVARIVRTALEAKKPKARYLIGKGSGAIPYLRLLPANLLDVAMQINLGLRKPPVILGMILARTKRVAK
jgi:NAD(P)-dependent dehydrogenase (short-subunit alcohol dehydrogenase family)